MTSKPYLRAGLLAAALATTAPLAAQNQAVPDTVDAADAPDVVELETPPVATTQRNTVVAAPEPEPAPQPAAEPAPVPEPEIINPYANSYNDLLPLAEGEQPVEAGEENFNPLNLLGLLGLLGLFGLRRRDRVVYAERIDPVVRREDR